jgi:hypothetical protein
MPVATAGRIPSASCSVDDLASNHHKNYLKKFQQHKHRDEIARERRLARYLQNGQLACKAKMASGRVSQFRAGT